MVNIAVLDYGSGNIRSAQRALETTGAKVEITSDFDTALNADGLLVPGVGAFSACMDGIKKVRGDQIIERRLAGGRAVMGICVGMQLLFAGGTEHSEGQPYPGLNQWPGLVEKLSAPVLPHMGWNNVAAATGTSMFSGVENERFYFVHTYAAINWQMQSIEQLRAPLVTYANYYQDFVAAVENGPLWSTQFHPEKSGEAGLQLLKNWVNQF